MSDYKGAPARRVDLYNAVRGVDLTEEDHRLLDWLATWDMETTDRISDLIWRARSALIGPAYSPVQSP